MPKYGVFIEGRNFLIDGPDGEGKCGFYTARFLEAPDAEAAELMAIDQLRRRKSLCDMVRNAADDPPMMYVTEIQELDAFGGSQSPGDQGLIWYNETGSASDER
jgi:hypothetical protein